MVASYLPAIKLYFSCQKFIYKMTESITSRNKQHGQEFQSVCVLSHFSRVQLSVTPGPWPTRILCPWDSSGKNTGVGCHFLLQCMKVKSESEVAQSCPTLQDPMDCSLPGSSIHGIFKARVLEWGAIAFSAQLTSEDQIS